MSSSSECGYDSESCDSETKCYCSLRHGKTGGLKGIGDCCGSKDKKGGCSSGVGGDKKGSHGRELPDLPCECDLDNCADEKCYCSLRVKSVDGTKFYRIKLDSGWSHSSTALGNFSCDIAKEPLVTAK